ncbi:MAG: SpoIID/LytB domain-containing protein [bacterium]
MIYFFRFLKLFLFSLFIFFISFIIYFYNYISNQVFEYFYTKNLENYKKNRDTKIIGIYFSYDTFYYLNRRYLKEFYFLKKFLSLNKIKYIIITDKSLNLLDSFDIDLLIVNDCRTLPINVILKFKDYIDNNGKILFTYQSLIYNKFYQKNNLKIYNLFNLANIEFNNVNYNYFKINKDYINFFKNYPDKILLSRKYTVNFQLLYNYEILAYLEDNTPFLVKINNNIYFLAENTFAIENYSNYYIYNFNLDLINLILNINLKKVDIEEYNIFSIIKPYELAFSNELIFSKFLKNGNFSFFINKYLKKQKIFNLDDIEQKINLKNQFYIDIGLEDINLNKIKYFNLIGLSGENKLSNFKNISEDFFKNNLLISELNNNAKIVAYNKDNIILFIKLNKQNGIEEIFSTYFKEIYFKEDVLVIKINMDDYIQDVVISEMPDSFSLEALKAQAIAARTYAFKSLKYKRHQNYNLCNKPHCQAFEGQYNETFKGYLASIFTHNLIITYNNKPIDALYHSTCGGLTANSEDVFKNQIPYLKSVKDYQDNIDNAYCKASKLFKWKVEFNKNDLNSMLSKTIPYILNQKYEGDIYDIILQKNKSQRINKLIIISKKGNNFYKYIAYKDDSIYLFSKDMYYSLLPSNFIEKIEKIKDKFIFKGRGFGHGVGMCQFGANYLGNFFDYSYILKHYYKGVTIKQVE